MPASSQDRVAVPCPHCGQAQREARTAFSTICQHCGRHFRVQDALRPVPVSAPPAPEQRPVSCFDCGAELEVAVNAESTMCKRCARYIDLRDYRITNAVSKNFKTQGAFVVEASGYVFNTEAIVGDAVIRGRFLGKLVAEKSLTIYSTANIKGEFKTGRLIIPADNHFRWPAPIKVGGAEIAGELAATLQAAGTVMLTPTARFFGDVMAKNMVVAAGAVFVGEARIGRSSV